MKVLRAAQAALLEPAVDEVPAGSEDASQKDQEQILAVVVLSGQGSRARVTWNCSAPVRCQPQPPVFLLPPSLRLAQCLAYPSLTTACATRPPPQQRLSPGGSSFLLFRTNGS